jgi:hypothetical protein
MGAMRHVRLWSAVTRQTAIAICEKYPAATVAGQGMFHVWIRNWHFLTGVEPKRIILLKEIR